MQIVMSFKILNNMTVQEIKSEIWNDMTIQEIKF